MISFVFEQWDYYFKRHGTNRQGLAIKKTPSEYFHGQIYTTFSTPRTATRNLPAQTCAKLARENVAKVYNIPIPSPVQCPSMRNTPFIKKRPARPSMEAP